MYNRLLLDIFPLSAYLVLCPGQRSYSVLPQKHTVRSAILTVMPASIALLKIN